MSAFLCTIRLLRVRRGDESQQCEERNGTNNLRVAAGAAHLLLGHFTCS